MNYVELLKKMEKMNDEIKELLKHIEILDNTDYILHSDKAKALLDYITKLQKENERLKEQCKEWKENHKAVCIQRDNILNNTVKDIEEQIDYKSRNEKAIDKLNTQLAFTSSYQLNYQSAMNIIEETKSILQGSDKE